MIYIYTQDFMNNNLNHFLPILQLIGFEIEDLNG